jgi:hypothetical protein
LVSGCTLTRIANEACSVTAFRRRRDAWFEAGIMDQRQRLDREAYDRTIGLELGDVAVDGCITTAPCGGDMVGRSPVDRGKQGLKRSTVVDAAGIPLGTVAAPANRHDPPLLEPTLDTLAGLGPLPEFMTIHLDRGYDSTVTGERLERSGLRAEISRKGTPAPLAAMQQWVEVRPNTWTNAHKKVVWCTERPARAIALWIAFSAVIIIVGRLIRQARTRYRWETRPTRRP